MCFNIHRYGLLGEYNKKPTGKKRSPYKKHKKQDHCIPVKTQTGCGYKKKTAAGVYPVQLSSLLFGVPLECLVSPYY